MSESPFEPEQLAPVQAQPAPASLAEQAGKALIRLRRVVDATPDAALRLRRVAQQVRETEPAVLAALLSEAARGSITGGWRAVYLGLAQWVLHARPRPKFPVGHWPLPDDELAPQGVHLALAVAASCQHENEFAHLILRDAFARTGPGDQTLLTLHPSVEKWPLGVRRERARGTDKNALQILLLDTTPAVVQILAENPRVLEPQAVQIASLRSQHPWALQSLLMVPRWLGNERVVEAVLRNSSTPGWLVLLLAPLVARRVQMAVVHLPWLPPPVAKVLADWHNVTLVPAHRGEEPPTGIFRVGEDGELEPDGGSY